MKTIYINGHAVTISFVTFQRIMKIADREGLAVSDAVVLLLRRLRDENEKK